MNNSSGLLLKIISDILDFSKIESEQLKIEPREFSCLEVITPYRRQLFAAGG